jgi:hypothetical protein
MGRRSSNYPQLRERAVRMVDDVRRDYPSHWPVIVAVAARLGIGYGGDAGQAGSLGRLPAAAGHERNTGDFRRL